MNQFLSQAPLDLVSANQRMQSGIEGVLGIRIIAVGPDFVCGEMPVDERTRQPFGILHGGASIVLAETLGSLPAEVVIYGVQPQNKEWDEPVSLPVQHALPALIESLITEVRSDATYGNEDSDH